MFNFSRRAACRPALVGSGLLLLLIGGAASWPAVTAANGQPGGGAPLMLRLRIGSVDPVRAAIATAPVVPAAGDGLAATPDLQVVQFNGPIRSEWRQALEATGAVIIDYLPDFAYLVRASPAAAARFAALPGHRWHGTLNEVGVSVAAREAHIQGAPTPLNDRLSALIAQRPAHAPVLLDVMLLPGEDLNAVERRLPGTVVQRFAGRRPVLRVQVTPETAARVAAVPGVAWVEPYVPPVLLNDVAAGVMRVPAVRDDLGLYGRGQVVAVADTGLDVGTMNGLSADFRGRVRHAYAISRSATNDWSDPIGHGTHVCGSILGSGALSGADPSDHAYDGSFAGMAPEANLVIQSVGSGNGSLALPVDLSQLFLPPYQNDGARIHSDSWGSSNPGETGQYLLSTWQLDQLCWQTRDLVMVFAAGNGGVDANGDGVVDLNSLSPQATAKNVISVGASESQRLDMPLTWGHFPSYPSDPIWSSPLSGNAGGMAAFSSRGPTADGRIKPDLVAPGTWILSARSHAPGAGTLWGAYNADYTYSGGTSMAAPLAAGAAALVREGLQERYGISDPSSALVKAALLNGADELAPGQYGTGPAREIPPRPNPVEGWGRLSVRGSLGGVGAPTVVPVDETTGLQTGDRKKYTLIIQPGDGPLRVTLTWTDPPSSMLAGPQLVNDLDLKLQAPDGTWLYGNGGTDRVNNVESIELAQPAPGAYTVVVDAYNVPQGPQPFGLVASGPIQPPVQTGIQVWVHVDGTQLPVADADVSIAGPTTETITTSHDGRIETLVPDGTYFVKPSRVGWSFNPPGQMVTVTDGKLASAEFTGTAPAGTLTGRITDGNGSPLAGVQVALAPGGMTAVTGADGTYSFTGLAPLLYTATPSLAGDAFTPASRELGIPRSGTAHADFSVATATVFGNVFTVGPVEAQPAASAHPETLAGVRSYTLSHPGAHWIRVHFTRIDAQPGAEWVQVLDSNHTAVSHWAGTFTDLWSAWIPGSSLTVQYSSSGYYARYGFDADVIQTDVGGQPVSNAAVSLQPDGRATQTDSSGGFRFTGVSSNGVLLAPSLAGWQFFPPEAAVTVSPGASQGPVSFLAQGPPSVSGQVSVAGTTQSVRFESDHPYANSTVRTQGITLPGASRLRLHFARLSTEPGADYVQILDPNGKELKRYSGDLDNYWTGWLPAGQVTVQFESDDSLNDWGYRIDDVASDAGAGSPVAGATVTLSPGGESVVTGADGSFQLSGLAPGGYTVAATPPVSNGALGLQLVNPTFSLLLPPWGENEVNFEAARAGPSSAAAVVAALSPAGQPAVQSFMVGSWLALPVPSAPALDQLLALQGVNDTPELIALSGGHLLHSRFLSGAWTAWQTLSGPGTDRAPVAAAEPDGTLDVLAVAPDGSVQQYRFVNGSWQDPVIATGVPAWVGDQAALVAREDGTLELVAAGSDGLPRHSRRVDGIWSTVGPVGSLTTAMRPALAVSTDGDAETATLELAFVSQDGRVQTQRFQSGAWQPPRAMTIGGSFLIATGPPALAAGPDARLELVVPAADGVYHGRMQSGSWSDAFRIDGLPPSAVTLIGLPPADPAAGLALLATTPDGVVRYLHFANGQWSAPATLAGFFSAGGS